MTDRLKNQLEDFDWNQLSLAELKGVESKVGKAIYLKQQTLNSIQTGRDLHPSAGYKVTVAKVFPSRFRNHLFEKNSCVLAISLGSKNFFPKRLGSMVQWVSEHFESCLVIIGDSVYRLTLEIRGQAIAQNNESLTKALNAGQEFLKENMALFDGHTTDCHFTFKFTSDIEQHQNFQRYHQDLRSLYKTSEPFTGLVNSFADNFLERGLSEAIVRAEAQNQKQLAISYLLEESALFTCLVEDGWPVFLYPGSIKTFEEIAEGLHPGIPDFLKQMIWVSLRLKQKNRQNYD